MSRNYKFHNPEGVYFVSFAVIEWLDVFIRNEYKNPTPPTPPRLSVAETRGMSIVVCDDTLITRSVNSISHHRTWQELLSLKFQLPLVCNEG